MARSYKRGWLKYAPESKGTWVRLAKQLASRTVRRVPIEETIPDGKAYRKYFNPYDIHDRISYPHEPMSDEQREHRYTIDPYKHFWRQETRWATGEWYDHVARKWHRRHFKRHGKIWKRT